MDEYVWVLRAGDSNDVPIGALILGKSGSRVKVRDDDRYEYWVSRGEIMGPMHPVSIFGVENMTCLKELQEYSILRNLHIRYMQDLIYTYIGSILVAVNPYKPLPIYDSKKIAEYRKKRLNDLPPHIFAVADHNYENMQKMSEKRCIIISGESGAGKTECTKLFLRYFATVSQNVSGKEQQILDSNPILEAFGNARTIYNDNSSRFGKYISINFNKNGSIHKAQIRHYLLEKSRVVIQNNAEQNYHIFYAVLNGLTEEEKKRLKLKYISSYNYLNGKNTKIVSSNEEHKNYNYEEIKYSMKALHFSDLEIWQILELLSAILHFGNIEFNKISISNIETACSVDAEEIHDICNLLQVSEKRLVESLTKKTISTHGENVVKLLSKQEAVNSRDAFVKKIFENLFNFLVEKINKVLSDGVVNSKCYIGILDIFGFEAFDRNSFEQLCINYASERLQQVFISHVFKMEQDQYESEGIKWKFIEYPDNKEILDLFETGSKCILAVINDTTKIPGGTDQCMLNKLIEFHAENKFFLKPKYKNTFVFGVHHFAGSVLYDIKDFIEKNHDACSLDMKQLVQGSDNKFLKEIFVKDFETDHNDHHKKRMETLALKFKSSLDLLMNELNDCEPFFIRCIKPNQIKKPQKFDRMFCCKQLRYSGMTEVTKIREAGYPVIYNYFEFVQRFRILVPGTPLAHKAACKDATVRICRTVFRNFPKADFQFGHTKVFLKHTEELFLEAERQKTLHSYAIVIQKSIRGWLARRRLLKLKTAVVLAENCWIKRQKRIRGSKTRKVFWFQEKLIYSWQTVSEIQRYHRLITRLQAYCRGYLIRNLIKGNFEKNNLNNHLKAGGKPNESTDFKEFSEKYFCGEHNYRFSKKPIKSSLTHLYLHEEEISAKAIWITILRYTGNVSEPKKKKKYTKVSVGVQLKEILQAISKVNKNFKSTSQKVFGKEQNTSKLNRLYEEWLKTLVTDIQKLHFIVGHGIVQPDLRDEIYCQICKVLTKNPSRKAACRGWDLLSSCTGCFPPSDTLLKYLKTFIRQGPNNHISFCLFRLHRLIQNGIRTQPPFTTELEAIQQQKPVSLEVFLENGAITIVKIDSATTAKELLNVVAKNIKLTDPFGFSFILSYEMGRLSLGDSSAFVLDAISECEQCITELSDSPENTQWRIHLKKEMFAPWHNFTADNVSTNLIYHQIKEGVKTGEYFFDERNMPLLIAQICYVEHGKLQPFALNQAISCYFPQYYSNTSTYDFIGIKEQVKLTYQEMFEKEEKSVDSVRADIVKYAVSSATIQFSRFFNLTGSIKSIKSNQRYTQVPLVVGMNSSGIFIIDENNEKCVIAKITYAEIFEVTRTKVPESQEYILKITNYEGTEIYLNSESALDNDLYELLIKILETLKKYSKFVMSVKNFNSIDKTFLTLRKGDLICLTGELSGKDLLQNSWAKGMNTRDGNTGNFLIDCVEIIPAIEKPPESIIKNVRDKVLPGKKTPLCYFSERLKHYNLEIYADKYFRTEDTKGKNEKHEKTISELWKYCNEKIQRPLHGELANKEREAKLAVEIFDNILKYSEKNNELDVEEQLVCKIFSPGIKNNELRNETYCQIMKQLTSNLRKESELKVWELMWMMTGLFACGEILVNEVKKFLQSRRAIQISRECLTRFYKILVSEPRKYPPHMIEIEAVKNKPCHIFHRVFFSDNTHKFFQLNSLTIFRELKEDILIRLKLSTSGKGFHLFLQIMERVFLLPDDYYLFDYLQILKKWLEREENFQKKWGYKICFMKYVSQSSELDLDESTYLELTFSQEYNKYIQGHYELAVDDIVQLAALLYKAFFFDETTQQFHIILPKLIPSNSVNLMKMEAWEKSIHANYNTHRLSSEKNCKVKFLNYLKNKSSANLPYFPIIRETSNLGNYIFYTFSSNLRSST